MKTNLRLSILLFVFVAATGSAQTSFTKTYGGANYDVFHSITATSDGGYILTGLFMSLGDTAGSVALIKTDAAGNVVFTRSYGGGDLDGGNAVIQTSDGGYFIAGHSESYGNDCQGITLRLDANGDSLWGAIYGNPDDDALSAVEQTADGGYILSGYTENYGAISQDILLIKIDANGNKQWQRYIGGEGDQVGNSVHQTKDGGYIIAGITRLNPGGDEDVLMVKTNDSGYVSWTRTFGGAADDIAYKVRETNDGDFVICGASASSGSGMLDYYLIKTDSSGYERWHSTFGGANDEIAYDVVQTPDNGFVLTGFTKSMGDTANDIYLVKTDASGYALWSKVIGGKGCDDLGMGLTLASDGGYAIAGNTACFGSGNEDGYLVKTDANGNIPTGLVNLETRPDMVVFPNPNNGDFFITCSSAKEEHLKIQIVDLAGKEVKALQHDEAANANDPIEIKGISAGIYFLNVENSAGKWVSKLIIE